jgi:hypothetical protein
MTTPAPAPPVNQPPQQSNDILDFKALMKGLFEEMGTMINLLTTVLTKLKYGLHFFSLHSGMPTAYSNTQKN